jgi:hypothetical protein
LDVRRIVSIAAVMILVLGFFVVFVSEQHHSEGTTLTGTCTVNDWYEGDAVEVMLKTVTTTVGNSTTYYTEYSTISTPTPEITASSTYTTYTSANTSTAYTIISTSIDLSAAPVGIWFVTTCAFAP